MAVDVRRQLFAMTKAHSGVLRRALRVFKNEARDEVSLNNVHAASFHDRQKVSARIGRDLMDGAIME